MSGNCANRVVVGLSGGVDSSMAAVLLLEQGYEVIGVRLELGQQDSPWSAPGNLRCGRARAVTAVRALCDQLGIPFQVLDVTEDLRREVIAQFAADYKAGRTPNPCILCNARVKFSRLLRQADALGAQFVATGHYARVERTNGRVLLKRGRDPQKDQSYFLFSLQQDQLARALFPLGDKTKRETRHAAQRRGLETAAAKESMEICFVPNRDYGRFLLDSGLAQKHRGEIVDLTGRVLGDHEGIEFFTIGQRKGLRVAAGKPLYVVALDAARNRVVVGDPVALGREEFTVRQCNWIAFASPPPHFQATVRIRYHHPGAPATVTPLADGKVKVKFEIPQRAVTPGQAAVFYQDDTVVGGGWIEQ